MATNYNVLIAVYLIALSLHCWMHDEVSHGSGCLGQSTMCHHKSSWWFCRYDEVDAAYGPPKHYPGGRSDGRSSHRQADRQNSGLSRQDSGVSSQSSRSLPPEIDAVSRISSITQHSSDSGSSGHQLSRQESDAASSYSSRASTVSTSTNCKLSRS